jgi:hypothetical protein
VIKKLLSFLSLFSSFGTLICCALPALLVSLGMGATLVSTLSAVPQLIWFSEHKTAVFLFAGIMLVGTFLLRQYSDEKSCPIDPDQARACRTSKKMSSVVFGASCLMYVIGAFFAFVAQYVF